MAYVIATLATRLRCPHCGYEFDRILPNWGVSTCASCWTDFNSVTGKCSYPTITIRLLDVPDRDLY